jgi:alkylation response protein AidB-like acyl-CoA dehydrogenase
MSVHTTPEEREDFRSSLRAFFAQHSPESQVRELMIGRRGFDPTVWRRMADELGLMGLLVPDRHGGSGLGLSELQVVMTELGRAVACAPFLSSAVLATSLLLESGDAELQDEYLPALAQGDTIAAVAALEAGGVWAEDACEGRAEAVGDAFCVTADKSFVIGASAADILLVLARDEAGLSFFVVDSADPGVSVTPLEVLDQTRHQSRVELVRAAGRRVGVPGGAWTALERALVPTAVALAAEQAGVARRSLEMAVEYSKVREQFGRKIGSFQAIKHKCADMLIGVETAEAVAIGAAAAVDEADPEARTIAHLAVAHCSEVAVHAATENIEVHGGIGFTWEHPAQLYYKRAVAASALLGTPMAQRELMMREMGR